MLGGDRAGGRAGDLFFPEAVGRIRVDCPETLGHQQHGVGGVIHGSDVEQAFGLTQGVLLLACRQKCPYRHALTTTRAPNALPVVCRQRRDVPHQHRVERPDVAPPQFERGRADERVDLLAVALELPFDQIAIEGRHHRRVLARPHHVRPVIQQRQVVAVRILLLADQHTIASKGLANPLRRCAGLRTSARLAPPEPLCGHEPEFVAINLPCSRATRQCIAALADECHRHQ